MATSSAPEVTEEVTLRVAKSTVLLVKDLLEAWVNETEWSHEVPVTAMRDWHRMRTAIEG